MNVENCQQTALVDGTMEWGITSSSVVGGGAVVNLAVSDFAV